MRTPEDMTARHHPRTHEGVRRLAPLALALALASGCGLVGADGGRGPAAASGGPTAGAAASASRPAELEAGLTSALVERVYATDAARTASAAVPADPLRASAAGAVQSLDTTSRALADLLGATYSAAREPLLAALQASDRAQVADAVALAGGGPDAAPARAAVERSQVDLAAVLRRVVPALGRDDVAERLGPDLSAQLAAEGPRRYTALHLAAVRARDTARLLTAGVAQDRDLGPSGTRAASLRADLTGLLTEHVLLVGAFARELAVPDAAASAAGSVREALAANSAGLGAVVGGAYPGGAEPFTRAWSAHVTRLEASAADAAAGRGGAQDQGLQDAPRSLAELFAGIVPGLPADRLADVLAPLLAAELLAVEAAARRSSTAPDDLHRAVTEVPVPAALLAAAVAQDLRLS